MTNDTTREANDAHFLASPDYGRDPERAPQFPSPDFPAAPAFWLRVPADWLAVPLPDAEMAVRAPAAVDGFHPNVVVRVRRVAASDTVTDDLFRSVAVGESSDG